MGKNYDSYVTSQNTPHLKARKILFSQSMIFLAVNCVLSGIACPELTPDVFILAVVFAGYTVVQLFDRRTTQWTWGVIAANYLIYIGVSAALLIVFALFWMLYVLSAEPVISAATAFFLLKQHGRKR